MRGREMTHNSHHVFFEKRNYKTPIEQRVRNLGAFVIYTDIVDHRELHANVPPPPKPDHEQLHDLYNFMQEHTYELTGLQGLEWAICWSNDRRLYELEDNLECQYFYLSGEYK